MGKKIALVAVNAKYTHTNPAIRALARSAPFPYRMATDKLCKNADTECILFEFTINQPEEEIEQELLHLDADAYCFSTYIWNIGIIKLLAKACRKQGAVVVLGGPEATYQAETLIKEKYADFIIEGEGEEAFALWTRYFTGELPLEKTRSLCFTRNGILTHTERTAPLDIRRMRHPYFDLSKLQNRMIYYETSRGCPFSCAYCLSSAERGVRFVEIEQVKKDLDEFREAGVLQVKFVDRTFNANPERAKEIFRYIIQKGGKTGYHFEIAAELLDEETVEILSTAPPGLIQLEIGVQTTNRETLAAIHRKQNFEKTVHFVRALLKPRNIKLHLDLIAGLPFEGMESFQNSFDDVFGLYAQELQLGFLKLLFGCELREKAEEYGIQFSSEAPYEVTQTTWISNRELQTLKEIEYLLGRYWNSGLYRRTIRYMAGQIGSGFCVFEKLRCAAHGKDLHRAGEYELAALLWEIGDEIAKELVRLDCLEKKARPKLPEWLSGENDQEKREFFKGEYRDYMPNLAAGKRPWHYARLERFSFDLFCYLQTGDIVREPCLVLFDYVNHKKTRIK